MDVIVSPDASDIKTIDMPLLKTVGGSLSIGGQRAIACPAGLEAFSAKRLTSIGTYTHGNLEVGASILQQGLPGCESLYKLDIPSLEYIGMGMAVLNNQHLQTLSLAKLSGFGLNPKNGDLQAPAAGEVLVAGNEDLKLYYAPKATQEGSTAPKYTIKENPSIKMIVAMNNDVGTFEIAPEQNIKSSLALYMLKLPKMPSLTVFPDSLKADKFEFAKLPDKLPGKELFEKLGEKLKEYEAAPTASPQ